MLYYVRGVRYPRYGRKEETEEGERGKGDKRSKLEWKTIQRNVLSFLHAHLFFIATPV